MIICLILVIFICFGFGSASASILDWKTYETDNFVVFYPQDYEWQAEEVLYYLEKNLPQVKGITGNKDDLKTYIVVQDFGIQSNGITNSINNRIDVFTNQGNSDSLELGNYKNWYRMVYTHELTHMLQRTNHSEGAEIPVIILGEFGSPNFLHVPRWLAEGVAIYSESNLDDQVGRLNDNYYQAVVQAKAKAGKQPSLMGITVSPNYMDYPDSLRYVYGAQFYQYLANKYGADKCAQLFTEIGTQFWGRSLHQAAKEVFGKSMPQLFAEWKETQQAASENWKIDGEKVIENGRGVISGLTAENGKLYYFKRKKIAPFPSGDAYINYLVEYDPTTGNERILRKLTTSNYSSIQIVGNNLYYAVKSYTKGFSNIQDSGQGYNGIIYCYNLKTGENKQIIRGRIKNFTVLNSGAVIYTKQTKEQFGSEIWNYQAGNKKQLGTVPQLISELETAQDKVIAVSKERVGSFGVNYLDLDKLTLTSIVDTKYSERAVNINGNKLYYTANYTGHQSTYEYNLTTEELTKLTEGGYAFNGTVCRDKVYFTAPSAEGIELYGKQNAPQDCKLPPQEKVKTENKSINLAELGIEVQENSAFKKNLSGLLPPDVRFVSGLFSGQDAMGANTYTIGYDGSISWTTKLFKPFNVVVSNGPVKEGNGRETILSTSYPVYFPSITGLKGIGLGCSTDFNNLFPSTRVIFSYPRQDIEFNLEGDVKNQGINSEVVYKYKLNNSGLKITGSRFNNFDKRDNLRGLEFDSEDNGYQLSTEYAYKLLELKK